MKSIWVFLCFISCQPVFNSGDCVVSDKYEKWNKNIVVEKIIEIGHDSYLVSVGYSDDGKFYNWSNQTETEEFTHWPRGYFDLYHHKIECPK